MSPSPPSTVNGKEGNESWEHIQDAKERKKVQNRIAQRSYRERVKRRIEALEQLYQSSETATNAPQKRRRTSPQLSSTLTNTSANELCYESMMPSAPSACGPDTHQRSRLDSQGHIIRTHSGHAPPNLTPPLDETYRAFEDLCNTEQSLSTDDLRWAMDQTSLELPQDIQKPHLEDTIQIAESDFSDDLFSMIPSPTAIPRAHATRTAQNPSPAPSTTSSSISRSSTSSSTHSGKTALHIAAETGKASTVAILMSMQPDMYAQDSLGRTALHLATEHAHEAVVSQLTKHRASINLPNRSGETALHVAASHGHDKVVALLLAAGSNVELKDASGRTALHLAVLNGHETMLRMLIEKGANVDARIQP